MLCYNSHIFFGRSLMATFKHLSPVTLKEQLYQELLAQIQDGTYRPGDKIPTELQLSEMYNISRVTVRQTLARLVDEQILIKRAGKGTFVKEAPFVEKYFVGGSFTDSCFRMNTIPSTQIICRETIESPEGLNGQLGDSVIHITRLRCVNGIPSIVEEDYFPATSIFLLQEDLTDVSFFSLVYQKTGLMPSNSESFFRIVYATKKQAELLGCSLAHALLEVSQNVMDANKKLIYINYQYIFSERYVYAVRSVH